MRDETIQHDGFEYNWFFRSKGWRSKAGRLNAGAWVRRRRWLRLMERPPLTVLQESEGNGHGPREPEISVSTDVKYVWRGDGEDWHRLHRVMRELGRDGRRLEVWKEWIGCIEEGGEDSTNRDVSKFMAAVLRSRVRSISDHVISCPDSNHTDERIATVFCLPFFSRPASCNGNESRAYVRSGSPGC